MCKGLQMVTWPQDPRRDQIATTEMADAIVRETDARQTKLDNNHSAHAQTHGQELVLNAMAWGTLLPTALAHIGICATMTLMLNATNCKSISTQTDSGRRQAHRAVRYNK